MKKTMALIVCEGYIPKNLLRKGASGALKRVCTRRPKVRGQIPYHNNHTPSALRRGWLICVFLLLAVGGVFAEEAATESPHPKNTVSVDIKPFHLLLWAFLPDSTVWGIDAQYERQLTEHLSATGRFGYGIYDIFNDDSVLDFWSFSVQGSGRFYPEERGIFFLEGVFGYAYVFQNGYYTSFPETDTREYHYLRFGGKIGWSIDFGKPGGFVLEPAIGFYGALGTMPSWSAEDSFGGMMNTLSYVVATALFAAGPQLSLSMGYRF